LLLRRGRVLTPLANFFFSSSRTSASSARLSTVATAPDGTAWPSSDWA
jgi:hypothetical protein